MPEIKHVFTGGKMNKDLDERFVPNGQYRDAMNIQVRTSDSGASGTVQMVKGNMKVKRAGTESDMSTFIYSDIIGSVINETTNKSYWFSAGQNIEGLGPDSWIIPLITFYKWTDEIWEYDAETSKAARIATDVYAITLNDSHIVDPGAGPYGKMNISEGVTSDESWRPGCRVQAWNNSNVPLFSELPVVIGVDQPSSGQGTLHFDKEYSVDVSTADKWAFWWDPVFEFDPNYRINAANVIDDFLFWTDGRSEPKKVNISRSKLGTPSFSHTKLYVPNAQNQLVLIGDLEPGTGNHIKKEHVVVIKPAPKTAPRLSMATNTRGGAVKGTISGLNLVGASNGQELNNITISPAGIELIPGDYILLENNDNPGDIKKARFEIISSTGFGVFDMQIQSVPDDVLATETTWSVELEQKKPLFELQFGRFAYRYKYVDGEYSAFSPWSELAFLPGEFDYEQKKGYNLGMVNNVRELKIRDFVADDESRPDDVDSVDILYKTTESPNVYVVKTIQRDVDPEWSVQNANTKGEIHITSEMIHKLLPSNQLLRAWDAVPRRALAQEIVGNRLLYANYVQNYNVPRVALEQSLSSEYVEIGSVGKRSVKSLRSYRVGVVYGDEYGRETPVQEVGVSSKYSPELGAYSFLPTDFTIDKKNAPTANRISVKQTWETPAGESLVPPDWIKYCKYYIKETSTDYHTLVMDRWYDAEDGNVWISFFSSERNKIDEDTYLILKNYNGSNATVDEEARYKVLDISNSAPDSVKATSYVIGVCNPVDAFSDVSSTTYPMYTSLSFDDDDWNSTIGSVDEFQRNEKFLRLKASDGDNTHKSAWIRITNISSTTSEIPVEVTLSEPLGPSADLGTLWDAQGYGTTPTYSFEFKVEKDVNLPEFDGRFFVKVYRDSILEKNVLHESDNDGTIWAPITGYMFRYLEISDTGADWDYSTHTSTNPAYSNATQFSSPNYTNYQIPESGGSGTWFGSMGFDELSWDDSEDHNDHVQNLGWCSGRTPTKKFWEHWGGMGWFLDAVRFRGEDVGNENYWQMNGDGDAVAGRGLWKSSGVTIGRDVMFFGNRNRIQSLSGGDDAFMNNIKETGTYFRFKKDPFERVFRVIGSSSTHNVKNYDNSNSCDSPPNDWSSSNRCVFWVQFRRVDLNTALPTNEGCDVGLWDPRGSVQHDGNHAIEIDIVTPFRQGSGSTIIERDTSIWETEPKESADIDLYYEASNALPMFIDENNIFDYAPKGSIVETIKRDVTVDEVTTTTTMDLDPTATVDSFEYNCIKFIQTNSQNPYFPNGKLYTDFLIGDKVRFKHHDGVETSAEIEDYVYVADANNPTPLATPEVSVSGCVLSGMQITSFSINQALVDQVNAWNDLGWRVLVYGHSAIPSGTYIQLEVQPPLFLTLEPAIDIGSMVLTNSGTMGGGAGIGLGTIKIRPVNGLYRIKEQVYDLPVKLSWHNCYTFGNGAESAAIRDDFNSPRIDNGVKASTILDDYGEEHRGSGLIWSGMFNSISGLNALNEFNMAEKITKDLNPSYGTIQALKTRDTNVVAFCEDKVLKILAQKDALFNADGSPQLTATDRVLGQAIPFVGDYGISNNPESLASDQYRLYFADKQRGAVLRLSNDGLTPISNVGMKDYFRESFALIDTAIGTFDTVNGDYNLTLISSDKSALQFDSTTVTFNEESKGWISFKSFIPQAGCSVGGHYVTAAKQNYSVSEGSVLWKHYAGVYRSQFYGRFDLSLAYIDVLLNDSPSDIKSFATLSFEGSDAANSLNGAGTPAQTVTDAAGNTLTNISDGRFDNKGFRYGWYCDEITTDQDKAGPLFFIDKENKYFTNLSGTEYEANTFYDPTITGGGESGVNTSTFNVQGLGEIVAVTGDTEQTQFTLTVK